MITVNFTVAGDVVETKGQPGESIMQVALQNRLPDIDGECGGEMSCATCHVYAEPQGFTPRSDEEDELLELVDDREDNSRLSCQLVLREGMGPVEIALP